MSEFTLEALAQRLAGIGISAQIFGDVNLKISCLASLEDASKGDITFLGSSKFKHLLALTHASAVILTKDDRNNLSENNTISAALVVENPHVAFAYVATWLTDNDLLCAGIHVDASVDPDSQIDDNVEIAAQCVIEAGVVIKSGSRIGPGSYIGKQAYIGEDCHLVANVTLCQGSKIGQRVTLHPGVVIGSDGFGLANDNGKWLKVPQVGSVVIGDDVDIGSNTTIDRGAIQDTIIEEGVKLDNQIQVGHNVRIGAHTAIAACTAIAGSATIGKHCAIGGCVGIVGHLHIADNVTITGMSHVTQSINKAGVYSSGTPLEENSHWHRNYLRLKNLDDMARRLKKLEKQFAANNEIDEKKK